MSRKQLRAALLAAALIAALMLWASLRNNPPPKPADIIAAAPKRATGPPAAPVPGDALLAGYAGPSTPPIDDLRKIHRVVTGYFSVVKDPARFPIGGNADLSAALRGENLNREVFVRPDHPVFSAEGLLADRWGSPLVVHPEAWKQLELRSAGPDRVPFTEDDLVLAPAGIQPRPEK